MIGILLNQTTSAHGSPPAKFRLTSYTSVHLRRAWGDAQTLGGRVRVARLVPLSRHVDTQDAVGGNKMDLGIAHETHRRRGNIGLISKRSNHKWE
jgi:hypothetical protein